MENRAHALAAGLFVLLLGIVLAAIAAWMQRDIRPLATYGIATTRSVSGLKAEAPVRFRGLDVGKVESMRFDPASPGRILITIGVDEHIPLTTATYAELGYQGVTGLAFVELDEQGPPGAAARLEPGPTARLPLHPSFVDSGEALLGSASEAVKRVNKVLDADHRDALKRALDGVALATQSTAQLADRLEASADRLPGLIDHAQSLTERAGRLVDEVGTLTTRLDERVGTLDRVAAASEHVSAAADRTGGAVRDVDEVTMPRFDELLDQLQQNTRTLERLLVMLSDQPQSLVFGRTPPPPGPGEPGFAARKSP